jgi:hypothetical protein
MRRTGIQAAYAYHIPLGNAEGEAPRDLAFGLALTAYQYAINTDELVYDHDDPYLNSFDRSVFIPDFNFGASYATSRYYVGFSMTNMLRGRLFLGIRAVTGIRSLAIISLQVDISFPFLQTGFLNHQHLSSRLICYSKQFSSILLPGSIIKTITGLEYHGVPTMP